MSETGSDEQVVAAGEEEGKEVNQLYVGKLRVQCALQSGDAAVFAKVGDRWIRVVGAWPDTQMAPRGYGLYLELDVEELSEGVCARGETVPVNPFEVNPFEALAKHFGDVGQIQNQRDRYRAALVKIAAYDDLSASSVLTARNSYSSFDEPNSVRIAREALAETEKKK